MTEQTDREAIRQGRNDNDEKKMLACKFIFKDDGYIYTAMPIPEDMPKEEIDEYISSGEGWLVDEMLGIERKEWKEQDGKVSFNTGTKGEVLGEAVDPWTEIPQADDGSIKYVTYTLVKAD